MSNYDPLATNQIDVRTLALRCFRDKVLLPAYPRLHTQINMGRQEGLHGGHVYPRLLQLFVPISSYQRRH